MEEWKECKLGDIYEVHNGLSKGGKFFGSGYPFLSFSTIFNNWFVPNELSNLVQSTDKEQESYSIKEGDVFITRTSETADELGMSCVALKDYPKATYNGFCKRMRQYNHDIEVLPKYIGYYLRNPHFRLHFQAFSGSMSTRASLTNEALLGLTVKLPPLPTQQKIAAILSSLDDKIELNNKINTNLEQQAQALFKNWFVDFEPFGGKMSEGWKVGKLSEIAEITSGKRPPMKQSDFSKDVSIPLVGAASVMGYTNQVLYNEPILITGRVGTHGVIQRFSTDCWPSDNTLVVKSKYYEYVYQIMKNIDYDNMNRGSTQPLITQSDLGKVECIIPDEENLNKFEKFTNSLFAKVQDNQQENQKLSNIRDTLLPKLMNGEIEV